MRIITTLVEDLSSVELKVTTGTAREKLYTIRQRPADMKRLAGVRKKAVGKGALKRLRAKVADAKITKAARTAKTAKAAGGGGAEEEEHERTSSSRNGW